MSSRRRGAEKGLQVSNRDKVLYPAGKEPRDPLVVTYYVSLGEPYCRIFAIGR